MDTRWKIDVTKRALNERKHKRLNKKYMLPSEQDIKTMSNGCKQHIKDLYAEFCHVISTDDDKKNTIVDLSKELMGVLMVRLAIYNR